MAESAALVPITFYPPVRYGTGSFRQTDSPPTPRTFNEGRTGAVVPETDRILAYGRDGEPNQDLLIGRFVDIYI
jgi:hypothetical protein